MLGLYSFSREFPEMITSTGAKFLVTFLSFSTALAAEARQ